MKRGFLIIILMIAAFIAYFKFGDKISTRTPPDAFNELSRKYCPDSSKFLLNYVNGEGGGTDGGQSSLTCILNSADDINEMKDVKRISFASNKIDSIYWQNNDTVILVERYTELKREGRSAFKDPVFLVSGVTVRVIENDPINNSFSRKIIYRETSPDSKSELIAYRYVKPTNQYYFLNVSVINKNDSIPKYGNFFIAKYDFDCISDIRWNELNELSIKAAGECYYSFKDYLVKNHPAIQYNLQLDATNKGNIRE